MKGSYIAAMQNRTETKGEIFMLKKAEAEELILRQVGRSDLEAVREYRGEFLEKGGSMDGCSNLRRYENMEEW